MAAAAGVSRQTGGVPGLVFVLARVVSVLCLLTLAVVAAFDTQAARFTSGTIPAQFADRLDGRLKGDYEDVTGVAHNAGDDLRAATRAVAYGADAIEIDVRSVNGELFASHDAPVPLLEDLVFHGPSLRDAWVVARLDTTVLLHLKQGSRRYLDELQSFLHARALQRTIVQTKNPGTLRTLRQTMPSVQRLLLIFTAKELAALRADEQLLTVIDGVSVRESLLSASVQAWFERRGLLTFAWVVNDESRMNQLVARGIDGLITDRLDIMQLLGKGIQRVQQ
jgi:glycerophosphoryl diester phosphodiesterase